MDDASIQNVFESALGRQVKIPNNHLGLMHVGGVRNMKQPSYPRRGNVDIQTFLLDMKKYEEKIDKPVRTGANFQFLFPSLGIQAPGNAQKQILYSQYR